jgi:polysaccharide biosynthesis protein PelF
MNPTMRIPFPSDHIPRSQRPDDEADVCLFVEGAYPYVWGGVSHWVQRLLRAQRHLKFHIVAITPDATPRESRYRIPSNVLSVRDLPLERASSECPPGSRADVTRLMREIEQPLSQLLTQGGREPLRNLVQAIDRHRGAATLAHLLNSEAAFEMVQRMAERELPSGSFLHYFWSWRSLVGGLYSVLLSRIPRAKVYHAVSTGYAGLAMARASILAKRPALLTEHGIYTNERRIEISMARWLRDEGAPTLATEGRQRDLRDVWSAAFAGYSRTAYDSSTRIVTLFEGNQELQHRDGANPGRMMLIPNGIDVVRFARIGRSVAPRRPTVTMMGRVVPIKDVKTFIRAAATIREQVSDARFLIVGSRDEDPDYDRECVEMVQFMGLGDCVEFVGHVDARAVFAQTDVMVFTSLSEAQPLTMLEAGAAGIPCVATDVGACREILLGRAREYPPLSGGGFVTPLANPRITAQAVVQLLQDEALRARCGRALQLRVRRYYSHKMVDAAYEDLYERLIALNPRNGNGTTGYARGTANPSRPNDSLWPAAA